MQIFLQKDNNISMNQYKNWFEETFFTPVWIEEEANFEDIEWESYNKKGDKGLSRKWIFAQLERLSGYYFNTIDLYIALIQGSNWNGDGILGWHLSSAFNDCRITLVKNRRGWLQTAQHETFHAFWKYIRIHTGIDLKHVLGASEYGVIHGDAEGFDEYNYEEHFKKIKPYLELARGEDMADEYRNLLQIAIQKAKRLIRRLRA
jgi:hypothetical protein